ncbi:hypothetical protein SAMN04488121_103851 [Chitinophaga filiformis]|uniref:Uncharacterized protein n=1 Tax=Chitinophaga filiformis TaxID=104663 RepID=A0A1G7SFG8_CHIFI|nr:hypothetical protein SAMN04488121_103851 [Chitinophaga filiformis]
MQRYKTIVNDRNAIPLSVLAFGGILSSDETADMQER